MERLTWSDSFNTGILEIDNQHRQIIEYCNQLCDAHDQKDNKAVGEVIEGLVEYTLSHFAFEESLMEEVAYPFTKAHKKIHEMFVKRVASYQEKFKEGIEVTEEFYSLLRRWLIQHIQRDDMAYSIPVKSGMHLLEQPQIDEQKSLVKDSWLNRALKKFFRH